MADTRADAQRPHAKREIERKYEATPDTRVPDLTEVRGVARVLHAGTADLDADYYDTTDLRLAAHALTLRRAPAARRAAGT